eukprot:2846882-Pleurochrysis_carterae.AAC.2
MAMSLLHTVREVQEWLAGRTALKLLHVTQQKLEFMSFTSATDSLWQSPPDPTMILASPAMPSNSALLACRLEKEAITRKSFGSLGGSAPGGFKHAGRGGRFMLVQELDAFLAKPRAQPLDYKPCGFCVVATTIDGGSNVPLDTIRPSLLRTALRLVAK